MMRKQMLNGDASFGHRQMIRAPSLVHFALGDKALARDRR